MQVKTGKELEKAISDQIDEKRFAEMAEENPEAPVLFIGNHPYIIDYKFAQSDDDCFEDYVAFLQFRLRQLHGDMNKLIKELDFVNADDYIDFSFQVEKPDDWEEIVNDAYGMETLEEYYA